MGYKIITRNGHDFFSVASALQKAIRRGDEKIACYCALELYHSGYKDYVWKRLYIISAEDVHDAVTKEIVALHHAFNHVMKGANAEYGGQRLMIVKAVLVLCRAAKSRDADNFICLSYDIGERINDEELAAYTADQPKMTLPEYAFDVHTKAGRARGKTIKDFILEEDAALKPRVKGLFDDLITEERIERFSKARKK